MSDRALKILTNIITVVIVTACAAIFFLVAWWAVERAVVGGFLSMIGYGLLAAFASLVAFDMIHVVVLNLKTWSQHGRE